VVFAVADSILRAMRWRWFLIKLTTAGAMAYLLWLITGYPEAGVLLAPFGWMIGKLIQVSVEASKVPSMPEKFRPAAYRGGYEIEDSFPVCLSRSFFDRELRDPVEDPGTDAAGIYWDDTGSNAFGNDNTFFKDDKW